MPEIMTRDCRPGAEVRRDEGSRRQSRFQGILLSVRNNMTRPPRRPDLIVSFTLTARRVDGSLKEVISGYRPIYKVCADHWASAHHEFVGATGVCTGRKCKAEVWLLSPEAYPHPFWIDRRVEVAEGSRSVGIADVLQIINPPAQYVRRWLTMGAFVERLRRGIAPMEKVWMRRG